MTNRIVVKTVDFIAAGAFAVGDAKEERGDTPVDAVEYRAISARATASEYTSQTLWGRTSNVMAWEDAYTD